MSDIKGLHRNYSEDGVEADEIMKPDSPKMKSKTPGRPPRKGSLSRNVSSYDMTNGKYFFLLIVNNSLIL